jgi:hypothetical protein
MSATAPAQSKRGTIQRQEGIGYGDVVQLRAREILRGVEQASERSARAARAALGGTRTSGRPGSFGVEASRRSGKHSEPQDRQRDATSPRPLGATETHRASVRCPIAPAAEETVEVVRNHADGTRSARMESSLPKPDQVLRGDARRASPAGVDAERQVDGGAGGRRAARAGRPRRIPREAIRDDPGRPGALNRSQDHEGRPSELFGARVART